MARQVQGRVTVWPPVSAADLASAPQNPLLLVGGDRGFWDDLNAHFKDARMDWQWQRVDSLSAGLQALGERPWPLALVVLGRTPLDHSTWSQVLTATPAIALVAAGEENLAASAMRAGFVDYCIQDSSSGYLRVLPEQVRSALHKRALQQSLQDQAAHIELVLNAVDTGLWDRDLRTGEGHVDDRWLSMLGYRRGEISLEPDTWLELMHPDDRLATAHAFDLISRGDRGTYQCDFRLRHKQGHWVWVQSQGKVVERGPHGEPYRMVGTHSEITDRKFTEIQLQRQHRLLQAVNRAQGLYIGSTETAGVFSDLLEDLLGVTQCEYGFIGEVADPQASATGLRMHAMTNIAWNPEMEALYQRMASGGALFDSPNSLVGVSLRSLQPVLSNQAGSDPRSAVELPAGHLAMHNFLGLPVLLDGQAVAMVGLANQPGGFRTEDIAFLQPLINAIAQIFQARRLKAAQERSAADLTVALDAMGQGILRVDRTGRVAFYNRRLLELLDLPADLLDRRPHFNEMVAYQARQGQFGQSFDLVSAEARDYVADAARTANAMGVQVPSVYHRRTLDGRVLEVHTRFLPEGGMVRTFLDVTDTHATQDALRASEAQSRALADRLSALLEALPDVLLEVDESGTLLHVGQQRRDLLVAPHDEMIGRRMAEYLPPDVLTGTMAALQEAKVRGTSSGFQYALQLPSGLHWFELSVARQPLSPGETQQRFVLLVRDVTSRKRAEHEVQRLAYHDDLTGLPNRRLLQDRLQMALVAAHRQSRHGALLFIDLDNFKDLNDTQGHDQGDRLLEQVSQRLKHAVRACDTVARLGGDEFVVMLEDLHADTATAAQQAETLGLKILHSLNDTPYALERKLHVSTCSIGLALFGEASDTVDDLLKRADLAMYRAKLEGRNTLRFFDPDMQSQAHRRAALESDLRLALEQGQLSLHYQPVVNAAGVCTGAEALLRWMHPARGMVSPAEFIPVAEQSGLIIPLGRWVLETACRQLREWAAAPVRRHWTLAVNVSALEFRHPEFVPHTLETLERLGTHADRLKLELTESLLLQDVPEITRRMGLLKDRGVRFSLDDFGTGYSSLGYLKRLPIDQLKIDQSFVRDVLIDPEDGAIVRAILTLAQSLGMGVVAEGVETTDQFDFLVRHGCQSFQGYLFGRPAPVTEAFKPWD